MSEIRYQSIVERTDGSTQPVTYGASREVKLLRRNGKDYNEPIIGFKVEINDVICLNHLLFPSLPCSPESMATVKSKTTI
jgi:hypothetical protein